MVLASSSDAGALGKSSTEDVDLLGGVGGGVLLVPNPSSVSRKPSGVSFWSGAVTLGPALSRVSGTASFSFRRARSWSRSWASSWLRARSWSRSCVSSWSRERRLLSSISTSGAVITSVSW